MRIEIGRPELDGKFLVYGFSAAQCKDGVTFRRGNVVAAVRLPLCHGITNIITWKVKAPAGQGLSFHIGGEEVGHACIGDSQDWEEIVLHVPAQYIASDWTEIAIQCDKFLANRRWEESFYLSEIAIDNVSDFPHSVETNVPSQCVQRPILFGDLHIHSSFSHCQERRSGSAEAKLGYCRDKRGFHFAALTDHVEDILQDGTWEQICKLVEEFTDDEFVVIPAYEWTSDLYGHRNVYLEKTYEHIYHSLDPASFSPTRLRSKLQEEGQKAIIIPHHPIRSEFPMRWDDWDPDYEPVVEICSAWGSSEYFGNPLQERRRSEPGISVQDALARGFHLGFVGGSDSHWREPGTGGLTGVIADKFSRTGILEALRLRRCYATTGAPIRLWVTLNGRVMMGEKLRLTPYELEGLYPLIFNVSVEGTAPIARIELVQCNHVVQVYNSKAIGSRTRSVFWDNTSFLEVEERADEKVAVTFVLERIKRFYAGAWRPVDSLWNDPRLPNHSTWYYVRVFQSDGHMAWSSPIWLECVVGEPPFVKVQYGIPSNKQ